MEWSDEMVLEFLHNFEAEPIIWDPKNVSHKKKHLVADAWRRLKSNLSFESSTSVEELKKKKDSLMAYYRIHLNKMKNCKKSGMATEETYKTNWFAFPTMHSFLAPVYECTATINTEEITVSGESASDSSLVNDADESRIYSDGTPMKKRRQQGMSDLLLAKKQLDDAYSMIKQRTNQNKPEKLHECDLYAQLLAEKLKKNYEDRRTILMHNIDNLVFRETMSVRAQLRSRSEAASYSTTPSPSNQEFMFLHSPHPSSQNLPSPHNQISMHSPQSLSQANQKKINIVSQEIIHPPTDSLAQAYYSIVNSTIVDIDEE